jgi:hypothetical protein
VFDGIQRGRGSNNQGSKVILNTVRKELRNKVETFIWFGETPCWKVLIEESNNESSEKAFLNTVRKVLRKRIETCFMVGDTQCSKLFSELGKAITKKSCVNFVRKELGKDVETYGRFT